MNWGLEMNAKEIIDAGLYDVALYLMDDEIREDLHAEMAPCMELDFLEAYMQRHFEKYGIEFTIL